MKALDERVRHFVRYRVRYQKLYSPRPGPKKALVFDSPELVGLAKLMIGWALSNLAWEILFAAIKNWTKSISKKEPLPPDVQVIIKNQANIKVFYADIKLGLAPIRKIKEEVRVALEEEMLADGAGEIVAGLLDRVKNKKVRASLKKELHASLVKHQGLQEPLTRKEKRALQKFFSKYRKRRSG